jgi:hypothetical protein
MEGHIELGRSVLQQNVAIPELVYWFKEVCIQSD